MSKLKIKINCDLGESLANWTQAPAQDQAIMPNIHLANIACGFHAGDALTMTKTVALAKANNVVIGAHPSYQDLIGFGRRSIQYNAEELIAIIHYQLGALQGICKSQAIKLTYVKPHGALYNDMMKNQAIFKLVCQAINHFSPSLPLVIQALPDNSIQIKIAKALGVKLWFEAFADRHYQDNGLLVPRTERNAVIKDVELIEKRAEHLLKTGELLSINGKVLQLNVDTLCIHGDHPNALLIAEKLHAIFSA